MGRGRTRRRRRPLTPIGRAYKKSGQLDYFFAHRSQRILDLCPNPDCSICEAMRLEERSEVHTAYTEHSERMALYESMVRDHEERLAEKRAQFLFRNSFVGSVCVALVYCFTMFPRRVSVEHPCRGGFHMQRCKPYACNASPGAVALESYVPEEAA